MTAAEILYRQILTEIPEVKEGKMFGALCMKVPSGKAGSMFWRDNLVVRLQGDRLAEVKSLDGAVNFDPMDGRPMKEWIVIPYAYCEKWKLYAEWSVEFVSTLK